MPDTADRHCEAGQAPPSAVLDTQVVLDWLVFRDLGAAPLARALESSSLRWLTCQAMRDELEHVLDRGVAAAWKPVRAAISQAFNDLALRFEAHTPRDPTLRCSDPDDQMFIDLALATGARWLFTRDRALLHLARQARARGLIVLKPADWEPASITAR